jgi:hypothetical protein
VNHTATIQTRTVTTKEDFGADRGTNRAHTEAHKEEATNFEGREASIEAPTEGEKESPQDGENDHDHLHTQEAEGKIETTGLDHDPQGIGHPQQSALTAQENLIGSCSVHMRPGQRRIES